MFKHKNVKFLMSAIAKKKISKVMIFAAVAKSDNNRKHGSINNWRNGKCFIKLIASGRVFYYANIKTF